VNRVFGLLLSFAIVGCGTVSISGLKNSVDCSGSNPTFAANVVPVFSSKSCDTAGCHIGGAGAAGGLDLDTGLTATEIYDNIIASDSLDPATDPDDPLNTVLIAKPLRGLLTHEGGDNFEDLNDPDYQQIYCWIADGAQNN